MDERKLRFAPSLGMGVLLWLGCALLTAAPAPRFWAHEEAHAFLLGYPPGESSWLAVGDLNGDRAADLIVVNGEAHVFFGPIPALPSPALVDPDVRFFLASSSVGLGSAVTGDINGDYQDDLILGWVSPCVGGGSRVYVVYGRSSWPAEWDLLRTPADATIASNACNASLWPLPGGDLDGDGFEELFVGMWDRLAVFYGGGDLPALVDLATDAPDLDITGAYVGRDALVADVGGGRDLLLGGMAGFFAPGRWTGSFDLDAQEPDFRIEGLYYAHQAGVSWRQPGVGPPLLLAPDYCDPRSGSDCDIPFRLRAVDVSRGGTIDFSDGDPPQLRATLLGAHLPAGAHRADLLGGPSPDLLLESNELPRSHVPPPGGGMVALETGRELSGEVDLRWGRGAWHAYGAGGMGTHEQRPHHRSLPFATGDLTGDGLADVAAFGYAADGEPGIVIIAGGDRQEAPTDPVFHVDTALGDDANDGLSWATSFQTLERGLGRAELSYGICHLLVAEGEYEVAPTRMLDESWTGIGPWASYAYVGQGIRVLGGHPSGGGPSRPWEHVTSVAVEDPWHTQLSRLVLGTTPPDRAAPPAVLDGIATQSVLMLGPSVVSNCRLGGAHLDLVVEGWCDPVAGWCEFGMGTGGQGPLIPVGAALRVLYGPAWAWNNLIEGSTVRLTTNCRWEPGEEPCFATARLDGGIVSIGGEAHFLGNTVAGNVARAGSVLSCPGRSETHEVRRNVFWGNDTEYDLGSCRHGTVERNLYGVSSGPLPSSNLRADPLFAGDYRLSHIAAGQPAQSPAKDAGGTPADQECHPIPGFGCMSGGTTRTDGVPDAGEVDLGFHAMGERSAWSGGEFRAKGGDCRIDLDWSPTAGSTELRLYRGESPGGENMAIPVSVLPPAATAWRDTDVVSGATYYYRLGALRVWGEESLHPHEASAVAVDSTPPEAGPVTFVASGCDVSVTFTADDPCSGWDGTADIYRGGSPAFLVDAGSRVGMGIVSPFADSVAGNGLYYYRLVFRDTAGNEGLTPPREVRVDACGGAAPGPGGVALLLLRRAGGDLEAAFTPAAGADFHRLLTAPLATLGGGYLFRAGAGPDGQVGTTDDEGLCRMDASPAIDRSALARPGSLYFLAVGVNAAGTGPAGWDGALAERGSLAADTCP